MMKFTSLLLVGFSVLALTACEASMKREIADNGRYWQRVDTTDSVYQRGPKAQQMLFDDMSRCTAELNELERLSSLRNAVPANTWDKDGKKINPNSPEGRMANWDSPERRGYLLAEHTDYHDFEGCMTFKGWERVKYMNYETADRARDTYLDAIGYQRYRTKTNERVQGDYKNLNQ
jgi:hypothetical protein